MENASEAVLVAQNEKIKYVNPRAKQMVGYSYEELISVPFAQLIHPDDRQTVVDRYFARLTGESPSGNYNFRVVSKNGDVRWVELNAALITWEDKPATLNFLTDVTERRQAELALEESNVRFKAAFMTETDALSISTRDEGRILEVNDQFLELWGYTREELIGRKSTELKMWVNPEMRNTMLAELNLRGQVHDFEILGRKKDGQTFWDSISLSQFKISGTPLILIASRDITKLKLAEEERRQLEDKAQAASRLAIVGEMAAGVAHEINNPLTGVLGFSQIILEKENLPADIKEDVKLIADGSRRVSEIVKRLLTYARQSKPVRTLSNLNELIANTLKLRDYVLKTANIEVITRYDPELPLTIVDPGQLQQVFLNLIVNAEQAMKGARGRGTLTITTEKKGNMIRMSFQDDGPGITKENMGHLFQPFFTTKAPGEGTGLGLSLSRSIVSEHGGGMNVESEFGHGANFIIELPIIESLPSEADVQPPTAAKNLQTRRRVIYW